MMEAAGGQAGRDLRAKIEMIVATSLENLAFASIDCRQQLKRTMRNPTRDGMFLMSGSAERFRHTMWIARMPIDVLLAWKWNMSSRVA